MSIPQLSIVSVNDLAQRLRIDPKKLRHIAAHAGDYYRPFQQSKRPKPFAKNLKSAKVREIDNPSEILKTIQRRICDNLLCGMPWPEHVFGGIKEKNTVKNAKLHLGNEKLVTIDIRSYFPSISNKVIYDIWSRFLGCGSEVSALLTQLTTFRRRLPQGAPTSTALANLVLISIDGELVEFCRQNSITYTTWVDDLAFSGENAELALEKAISSLRRAGLRVARNKVKVLRSSQPQILMNQTLNNSMGVKKSYSSDVRSAINKLLTHPPINLKEQVASISSKIRYVGTINKNQARALTKNLNSTLSRIQNSNLRPET